MSVGRWEICCRGGMERLRGQRDLQTKKLGEKTESKTKERRDSEW
ncbi:hypothetical protein KKC1_21180 [Calderihabitans maritimus]|uniref:Uncharacterized protein n=1 Tax=Calderihabitans maritimus TaxID=1246530 RepID=A0A1Z5HTW4_9FIRM|nr:hypothetical protein KKC1_21180 [Calderihabitans maritimus]